MKATIIGLFFIGLFAQWSFAQNSDAELKLIQLSKDKWQWMADKNVDKLEPLFHDKAKFVHMSGTWKKDEELDIIKTGRIWYKHVKVHDTAVEMFGKTASLEPDYAGGGGSGKCGDDRVYRYRDLSKKRQALEAVGIDFQQRAGYA